jgi:hypothetical protein
MHLRESFTLALAICGGFVGGSIATSLNRVSAATPKSIQASRFELVDEAGKPIAFWGVDTNSTNGQQVVISFTNSKKMQVATFGIMSQKGPFLKISASDGKPMAIFELGWQERPVLIMNDHKFEGRMVLGSIENDAPSPNDDDWGIAFRAPTSLVPYASMGLLREPTSGRLSGVLSIQSSDGKRWAP